MTNGVKVGEATRRFGTRGLSVWLGRVNEEYLNALKNWVTASKVYKEMQDDAVIGTLLDAIKAPLLAAEFDVVPGGETPGDEDASAFLWDNMNGMTQQTWRSHVQDMLESIDFGFAIGEIVMEKRDDGKLWIGNLDPRGQETLERWEFDENENVSAFIQRDPVNGDILTIPSKKMIRVTFRGRKGNPHGKPLLRSLYRIWKFLKNLENLEGIGIERDVGGTPVYTDPPSAFTSTADETEIDKMLTGLRMDEQLYVRLPNGATLAGYGGGSKLYDVGAVIERKKKEILMRMFAQFLMLGMEQVGTQALVKGSQDFFSLGLIAIQQCLLEAWQQQLVPFLFQFNTFPGMTGLPTITWSNPGTADIQGLLDAYVKGVTARVLTPVEEDEDHFRGALDLPDRPEGVGEGSREAPVAPTFPGFG
ncbi:MAG: hypothetical protein V3S51_00500 [Dehalococcoidia bacterium]